MNVVMTGCGGFVEIQGTAEGAVFSKEEMDELIGVAQKGIRELTKMQKKGFPSPPVGRERERGRWRFLLLPEIRERSVRSGRPFRGSGLQIRSLSDFKMFPE